MRISGPEHAWLLISIQPRRNDLFVRFLDA